MTRIEQTPAARRTGGAAQGDDLGVGGGILAQLALVVARREQLSFTYDHRTDGHVLVFGCTFGLSQGEAHEVVIAWKEAFAHFSEAVSARVPAPEQTTARHDCS